MRALVPKERTLEGALAVYGEGAARDCASLLTFLRSVWRQGLWGETGPSGDLADIRLDPFDLEVGAYVDPEGRVTLSLGLLLAVDGMASMLANSFEAAPYVPTPLSSHLNERFPLFSDYSFLTRLEATTDGGVLLAALMPGLPETERGQAYWRLIGYLMLAYVVYHEAGHLRLGHLDGSDSGVEARVYEFEADTYASTRFFHDFYRHDFCAATGVLSHTGTLYQILCSVSLATHALLQARVYADPRHLNAPPTTHPTEQARFVSAANAVHNAIQSCSTLNNFLPTPVFPSWGPLVETYLFGKAVVNVNWSLVVAGRLSILNPRKKAEIVIDPTGRPHVRFPAEQVPDAAILDAAGTLMAMWWLWSNVVEPPVGFLEYGPAFREWRDTCMEGEAARRPTWDRLAEVTLEGFQKDPAVISTSRYFAANCDSVRYAAAGHVTVEALWGQATTLVEAVFKQGFDSNDSAVT